MNVNYHISTTAISEDFIAKIYEASSPDALIASTPVPAPHVLPFSVSFNGLDKVTHIVRLFGVTSGQLYHEYDAEPTEDITTIFDDIKFKIGDGGSLTPPVNTGAYSNPILIGLTIDDFRVWRNGYGFLYPNLHYGYSSVAGEISLVYPDVFGPGEEVLIQRKSKSFTTPINDSVVGKQFGGNSTIPEMFIDVNSTVNYAPEHLRHLIRLAGANANYVFPVGAAIPIGYIFRVTNFGPYALITDLGKVTFSNAPLLWGSTPKTELDIQFTGTYEFEFDGTNWNCTMYNLAMANSGGGIVQKGSFYVGPISTSDTLKNIPITYITVPYIVIGNLRSYNGGGVWNVDNGCTFCTSDLNPASFNLAIKRIASYGQNLKFDFIIIT